MQVQAGDAERGEALAIGDLSDLIDRLCIVNLKIWHLEEAIRNVDLSDEEVGALTRKLTPINEERSTLKSLINNKTGLGLPEYKIYGGHVSLATPDALDESGDSS